MVVGYHNFRKTPYVMYDNFKHIYQSHTSVMGKIIPCILGFGDSSMLGNRCHPNSLPNGEFGQDFPVPVIHLTNYIMNI